MTPRFVQGAAAAEDAERGVSGPPALLRRSGPYLVFDAGPGLEVLRFDPLGPAGSTVVAEGAVLALGEAEGRFVELGERLRALKLGAAPAIHAVSHEPGRAEWLQARGGPTLEDWLQRHGAPLSRTVVAAFIRRLATAMEALHGHGLVHGAISPRSIRIDRGRVTFTEFGIDTRALFGILRSQEGLVEPGYAAPEAHDGARRQPIGPPTDLYGASAVIFRLVAGRAPAAATDASRLTGRPLWPEATAASKDTVAGIEAGMAMAAGGRPADAAAWLAAFDLGVHTGRGEWFEGVDARPLAIPGPADDGFGDFGPVLSEQDRALRPPPPARGGARKALVAAGVIGGLMLVGGAVGAVWRAWRVDAPGPTPAPASTPTVPAPRAPSGCAWMASGPSAWRLSCGADRPVAITLPEGFGVRTVAEAERGDVVAAERLGTFYRLRAGALGGQAGQAYAYQAYDWLGRAADAGPAARGDSARARDDAALALGAMLARGEGRRAPDLAHAEARLRQAAAGNRADAVMALGSLLRASAGRDAGRLAEARRLFWRVAQLRDGSPLQQQGARALSAIDAAAKAAEAARPPPAPKPEPVAGPPAKPRAARPQPALARPPPSSLAKTSPPAAEPPASHRAAFKAPAPKPSPPAKATAPPPRPRTPATTAWGLSPRPAPFTFGPSRSWSASAFIQVDPDANFDGDVRRAGQDLCRAQGGEALSVRAGEVVCPNGVAYCQVRAVAACEAR